LESYETRRALADAQAGHPDNQRCPGEHTSPDPLVDPFAPGVEPEYWRELIRRGDQWLIEPLVETALEELAIPLAKGDPMFERVVRQARRAGYLAARRNAARSQGIYAEDDEADWLMAPPAPAAPDASQPAAGSARPVDPRPATGAAPAMSAPAA